MALIPDRRHDEQNDDDSSSTSSTPLHPDSPAPDISAGSGPAAPSYRELLERAGLDLTGHPLADRFDSIADEADDEDAAVTPSTLQGSDLRDAEGLWSRKSVQPSTEEDVKACIAEIDAHQTAWLKKKREAGESPEQREARELREAREEREAQQFREDCERESAELDARFERWDEEKQKAQEAARAAELERAERHRAVAANTAPTTDGHPLLDEYRWSDLEHIAPEVTGSVEQLQRLLGELSDFSRPMGPDDAVTVLDGLETLDRLTESLSVVTLSVFDRVGTPRDYGAKTTKALVQNRLNLSSQEAHRRTQLAEHLGKRTAMSGESIEPQFATLSAALRNGTLSSNQASTIIKCLKSLPPTVSEDDKLKAERLLVEKAPSVRVRDIHALFEEICGWIDPDGRKPKEAADRDDFNVNLRQLKDGTWTLKGRLDAETGGVLNGLLTSRIKTDAAADEEDDAPQVDGGADGAATTGGGVDSTVAPGTEGAACYAAEAGVLSDITAAATSGATASDSDQAIVDTFAEVLRGDRSDCLDPSLDFSQPQVGENGEIPQGAGVREDGTLVAMAAQQPSVRRRIYERFSSLVGGIEMNRIKAGAAYALVVTAKAEDLATQTGKAATGVEAPFPINSAALEGLNGSVFFHLMGKKTKSLALATERRLATEKQLAILASRDQGCSFPGCDTPPGRCEAHHIVPWADEGETDVNNLTLACSAHHHLIDKSDWYCIMLRDGRPAWVPPASVDPSRTPVLHARFIAREIAETLFG
ncbi:HNH endonuclease signature motif containing protein [Brevibacterium atlanticum]|uniref:HNH endonuclease signature motif containing protein n=1 Tax=Brevibacterium atlanticum TaxID=2697563 RepID=UPI00141D9FC5|nr:HNH endonuclease signature motif containing protein [Brevibacterium atlanticum]